MNHNTTMQTATKNRPTKPDLTVDVRNAVTEVQAALSAILESTLTLDATSGDLARTMKIDRTLAWKLIKVANEPDALNTVQYLPGASGMRIFLKAAKRKASPSDMIKTLEKAVDKFLAVVDLYAQDRSSFDMMVSACAKEGQAQAEIVHRRASFKGNSFTLGVQARTMFKAFFETVSSDANYLDIASLRGTLHLRRIRPNIDWTVARLRSSSRDSGDPTHDRVIRQSLADLSDISGTPLTPLIPCFCTQPLPELITTPGPQGFLDEKLVAGPLGKIGAVTCVSGDVWRGVVPRFADENNRTSRFLAHTYTPCEAFVMDKWIHEDLWGKVDPELVVFSEIVGGPLYGTSTSDPQRLEIAATVEHLGKGPAVARTPHIPGFPAMARYVFDKLGWEGERFNLYRAVIQFPPIPTTIGIRHEIPMED